jgi:acyl-coenzyme A thioesterase PaaI-like protein
MNTQDLDNHPIFKKAKRAIALTRTPGYHFCGNFFDFVYDNASSKHSEVHIDPEPQNTDHDQSVHLVLLAILADMGLATGIRYGLDDRTRLATVSLSLQFTGARPTGRVVAVTDTQGHLQGAKGGQGLSLTHIKADNTLIAVGYGAFMILPVPNGASLPAVPWVEKKAPVDPPLDLQTLTNDEKWILERVKASIEHCERTGEDFASHFLNFHPHSQERGAYCEVLNGPHVANRVGHVQGGVILALGMVTANAALGEEWMLSGVTATYISPGEGEAIHAQSKIIHQGRMTAVVQTSIYNKTGRQALEVLTTHARRADPAAQPL